MAPLATLGAITLTVVLIAGVISIARFLLEPKKAKRK